MNNKLEARFNRNNASVNNLIENKYIWSGNKALSIAFEKYWTMHEESFDIIMIKGSKRAGVSTPKKNKKAELATLGLSYAGTLRAYAADIGDDSLREKMTFGKTELMNLSDAKLPPRCKEILEALKEHSSSMADYDVTAVMIEEFATAIAAFRVASSSVKNAGAQRKSLNTRLEEVLNGMDKFVDDQLDPLMLRYISTHRVFYNEYKNNRTITDPKTSATQFAGLITAEDGGNPLKNVLITVQGSTYITNARLDGTYKLRIPKNGAYTIVFELAGYETVIITEAELKLGKTTELNVVMKKLA